VTEDVRAVIEALGLEPLHVEGGMFRQTWQSPTRGPDGRPLGTSILAAFSDDPDSFSAMHRLPSTEIWHAAYGDPVHLLLLHPDGSSSEPILGHDVLGGQQLQVVIPAGTWMGASLLHGGTFGVFGCTMAPGFVESDYEGGVAEDLIVRWADRKARIRSLCREGGPLTIDDALKTADR
jgi:uncharacterized protein